MTQMWGVYAPNEGDPEVGRLLEIVSDDGWVTILDHQAGKDDAVRQLAERGVSVLVRFYLRNWLTTVPKHLAERVRDTMLSGSRPLKQWTRRFTWANEQNLAAESEGQVGAADGRPMTWAAWQEIARWNEAVLDELDHLMGPDDLIRHYPAVAYGHGEDWGYDGNRVPLPGFPLKNGHPLPAYSLMAAGIDRCHVLNVHPYTQRGAENADAWRGVERVQRVHALFPLKALFAAETGQFDVHSPKAPEQITDIGYRLQAKPYVIGFTPFILNSPDPGHAMNNWSENRAIEEAYRKTTRLRREPWGARSAGGITLPQEFRDGGEAQPSRPEPERPRAPVPAPPPAPPPAPAPRPARTPPAWCDFAVKRPLARNFERGRGAPVELIVDHIADGYGSPFGWFNRVPVAPDEGSSAHFWVAKNGSIEQYVSLQDTAWSNGPIKKPDLKNPVIAAIVKAGARMNPRTVSIEHEGKSGETLTPGQVAASRRLHVWLGAVLNLPLTRERVIAHAQIDSVARARCPGPTHPWEALLMPTNEAQATQKAQLEANVLNPVFKAQDWLAKNAKTERQKRWQEVLDFAFRDLKGEVA